MQMRFLLLWIFVCNSYPLDLWFVGLTERFVGRFCQRLDVSLGFGHCAPGSHISGIAGCWHSPPDQWAWDHFKSRWDESRRHED